MSKEYEEEPVILTLSSDEDEDESSLVHKKKKKFIHENVDGQQQNQNTFLEPINPKEPIIKPNSNYENYQRHHNNMPDVSYEKQLMLQTANDIVISLQCRYLRIGSYKVVPNDSVIISYKGIEVQVPPFAEGEKKPVTLVFDMKGILKVLAHLGHTLPVLFIYTTDPMAADIRNQLKMTDKNGFYFDPCSQEESQKRITILTEKLKVEIIHIIKNLLNIDMCDVRNGERNKLFEELTQKDANEILVKSSPCEIDSVIQNSKTSVVSYETKTLLVFPPPPNKGGISITTDDYLCLKEEQFLNDVLIDFYLKWLHMCHLSERDRERTHLFSTFFYKRLTAKPKTPRRLQSSEDISGLTPSQRRHSRVKSWTKNVDIFTKDFIVIPINEHAHWFLAVICFPNLNGPIRIKDGKAVPKSEAMVPTRLSNRHKKKAEIPVIDDDDWSDRDEAEGDDNELNLDDADDVCTDEQQQQQQPPRKRLREQVDPLKQPCILIFDSLSGEPRSRIVATLRDYLAEEHLHRKGVAKTFSKETMQGACPKVPQQMNFSDCGLFTLQFGQSFFECPLKDFRIPVQSLVEWFDQDVVGGKRAAIADLIRYLMDKHKPNHGINLPPIHSSFPSGNKSALDGNSSPSYQTASQDQQDYLLPDQMFMKKSDAAIAAKSKTEQLKSIHIFPKKCSDSLSDCKSKSTSVIRRTNRDSPQRDDGDKPTSIVSSVKYLSNLSCDRRNSSPKSGSASSDKLVNSLQLLQDSYGGINNESDDDIFMLNHNKSQKSDLTPEKRSPTINFPLPRCTR